MVRLRAARMDPAAGGLAAENQRLLKENALLRVQLEAARRAGKRQAAPFSKGDPKKDPQWPGRRSGPEYGARAHRPVPGHVDEEIRVALPDACPCCQGELEFEDEVDHYQHDIVWGARACAPLPRQPRALQELRQACPRTPPRSDQRRDRRGPIADRSAGSRDRGVAEQGARAADEQDVPGPLLLGVSVTPGGLHHAIGRLAWAAAPTCQAPTLAVRASAAVAADETGWRVAGRRQWLWVFVGDDVTVYLIAPGRGYEQAASVLGEDFSGVLERDGWAPYRRFEHARHQTCVAHHGNSRVMRPVGGETVWRLPLALRWVA